MKILYCNKYNFRFSGTEAYLFDVMDLMRSQSHQVALFSMADARGEPSYYDRHFVKNVDFKNPTTNLFSRARQAAHSVYSTEARKKLRRILNDFQPDVAHVRNIYHHLSPSILWELKAHAVPVLYHLNDFKILCPSYNMVSKGKPCEKCRGGKFWNVVREGCYEGARGSAWTLAAEAYTHKWLRTYEKCITRFLAPSQFVKDKLIENGWSEKHIQVLRHFQRIPIDSPINLSPLAPIVYFGRLSPEKGVDDLLRAMQRLPEISLVIAGEGPQRAVLERLASTLNMTNVKFTGHLQGSALDELIAASRFTVMPSRAYETMGKSILESFASGRAVIASDLGSRRELVQDGKTGILFPPGDIDQLTQAIASLHRSSDMSEKMGTEAREYIRQKHSHTAHYSALSAIYGELSGLAKDTVHRKRLRVAFVGGRGVVSKYSGVETWYEEGGKTLASLGHEITLYCRTYFTPPIVKHEGMTVVRLPTIRSKHLETLVHTFLSTTHAMFTNCDIVHYHALGPALFSFLPRLAGKKTVVTVQGLDWQRTKWGPLASNVLRLGEKAAVWFPNATIVVSRTLQKYYGSARTTFIPNGASLEKQASTSRLTQWGLQRQAYILFLGRFSPEKNCHLLIEAYEALKPAAKLVLAGGSSYSDSYAIGLRKHQSDQIRVLDWVSGEDLHQLLGNALLFVLPSELEGMSLALLDAMSGGVCVLASDIPENREVMDGAGFTFKAGDVKDLQNMLRLLLAHASLREGAAAKAQSTIKARYLWPQIATQIERVYFEVMDGLPARRFTHSEENVRNDLDQAA